MKVSIFGIGKVGISLAASLIKARHQVIGVDTNAGLVNKIADEQMTFTEPFVQDIFDQFPGELAVTTSVAGAIEQSEISFIIVPTHSNARGGFSNSHVMASIKSIGECLAHKSTFHTVVVMSTVVPGTSLYELIPALERTSGKTVGVDIGFCYNPLFIAQGEIVKGIITPDYILIGESCEKSGDIVDSLHASMCKNSAPVVRMNTTEAEITKLASNTHETMRVAFANMLAQTCHEMPGTSVDNVTNALSFRLGKRFFKGATPYGGPCWPRDNIALSSLLNMIGLNALIPESVHHYNEAHADFLIEKIQRWVDQGNTRIGLIGVAYKPGTPLIDKSFAVNIVESIKGSDISYVAYDPLAAEAFRDYFPDRNVTIVEQAEACLDQQLCLLLQPLDVIQSLDWSAYPHTIIMDFWREIPREISVQLNHYIGFGINENKQPPADFINQLKQLTE